MKSKTSVLFSVLILSAGLQHDVSAAGEKGKTGPKSKQEIFIDKLNSMLHGIPVGVDARVFPYVSLDDWFDPYAGLKLYHPVPWNSKDRAEQHMKFETSRDFSWKIRYDINSFSSEDTRLSLDFKVKLDRDAYYYGLGNTTRKSDRQLASYTSVFLGGSIKQDLFGRFLFILSPGIWSFKSGLTSGGEFEEASDAKYLTTRLALSSRYGIDYYKKGLVHHWSSYMEMGLPLESSIARYTRLNFETVTRIPLIRDTKITLGNRMEWLLSPERHLVPYFSMPETGSKSGLRAHTKERFRNFALHVVHVEYSLPVADDTEAFLLTDIAQTGSHLTSLFGNDLHLAYGFGVRFLNKNDPISAGVAFGREGWKLFSTITTGKPW